MVDTKQYPAGRMSQRHGREATRYRSIGELRRRSVSLNRYNKSQEAQGLGALLDKRADNDHIKLDSIEI